MRRKSKKGRFFCKEDGRPRGAPADNLWAPPPIFGDRRAAAENLTATHRYHVCCIFQFLIKGHQKILRIERNFTEIFWGPPPAPASGRPAPPPRRRRAPSPQRRGRR